MRLITYFSIINGKAIEDTRDDVQISLKMHSQLTILIRPEHAIWQPRNTAH